MSALAEAQAKIDAKHKAKHGIVVPMRPTILDAAEIMSRELAPVRYVIPGWLPEGLTLLVANPKVGKSTLILQLAAALGSGGEFWGEHPPAATALIIDLETNERRLRRKLGAACSGEIPAGAMKFAFDWPRGAAGVNSIAEALDADPSIKLVVIDTLQRFRDSSAGQNAYAADYAALMPLHQLCKERPGLAIVVVHHKRKAKLGDDDPIDSINGSAALAGAADGIWILSRKAGEFVLHIQSRDWERDEDEFRLERADGRWQLSDAPRYSYGESEILRHLDIARGMTPTQLGEALKISKQGAHQRLGRMRDAGLVRCDGGAWYPNV